MKRFFYIFLVLAVSCARIEPVEPIHRADLEGLEHDGKVTFNFTPVIAGQDPVTRVFNTLPVDDHGASTIRNIYFAVFDDNGYKLSEYAAAVPNSYAVENAPATYSYSVELTITDQPRIVHIIANAPDRIPYGSETEVIGSLTSDFDKVTWDGDDVYWARIYLEHGVWAQPDPETALSDPNYQEKLEKFIEVRDTLSQAKLVRNFAKITLSNSASGNFQTTRFWLTNVPEVGSIAPYNRNTSSFQINYDSYSSVDALRGTDTENGEGNYQGFTPVTANLASIEGKSLSELEAIQSDASNGWEAFCFEREVPKSDPLYVIVGGYYDSDGDGDFTDEDESFYKIDLRDENDRYFPILRNFNYRINICTVQSGGSSTIPAALAAAPSGDVSTSIALSELTNISNGKSQIVVSETSRVIVGTTEGTEDVTLLYKYIPDVDNIVDGQPVTCNTILTSSSDIADAIANHTSYVTMEYTNGATGTVFDHAGTPWEISAADDANGYRTITFHPVSTTNVVKTEEVTITGHYYNTTIEKWEQMSRVITYRLREKLNMTLRIDPSKVPSKEGEALDLVIGIEAGLPSSVFTLDMKVESEQLSVTPRSGGLPVSTGDSSIPGSTLKSAFSFTKAITWDEYTSAPIVTVDGEDMKYFTCQFKTNTATLVDNLDNIYVSNQYFNQNHASYSMYAASTFSNITLSQSNANVGDDITLSFNMSTASPDGKVLIGLKGFEPGAASASALTYKYSTGDGYEFYEYSTGSSTSVSGIHLSPFTSGQASVRLVADEFTTAQSSSVTVVDPANIEVWADVESTNSTAIDWTVGSSTMFVSDGLVIGQAGKLTVYVSDPSVTVTIGGISATRVTSGTGNTITSPETGATLYAFSTGNTAYPAKTTSQYYPADVSVDGYVKTRYMVKVYGIAKASEVTSTGNGMFNTSRYYYFQNYNTNRYMYNNNSSGSTSILKTDLDASCLWTLSSGNNSANIHATYPNTTYYVGSSGNNNVSLRNSGQNWTFYDYTNNQGIRIRRTVNIVQNTYIYDNSGNVAVSTGSTTNATRYWHICMVNFTAPTS